MNKELDLTHLDAGYTRKLNGIAMLHKKRYTEFVDSYSKEYGGCYMWWALPFSSRNLYLDNTFQDMCFLHLCGQIISEDKELKRIVVGDKALYETILINYRHKLANGKIEVECTGDRLHFFAVIKNFFWAFKKLIVNFLRVWWYTKGEKYDIKEKMSLIEISALSSNFVDGEYRDRYFSGLQDYVKRNIYYIPSLGENSSIGWKKYIFYIRNSRKYRFILKEKFLSIFDFFFLLKYFVYCTRMSLKKYKYDEMDVTPLLRNSLLKGSYCVPSLKGILNYRFMKHFKECGYRVDNLISWYEGRPSDVMLHKAFRECYKGVNCVGYEGYPLSEFTLSQYMSCEQIKQKSGPVKVAIPGVIFKKGATQFCETVEYIYVPILRNKYELIASNRKTDRKKKRLLVILPYFIEYAAIMLKILNQYMQLNPDSFQIIIKNHPVNDTMRVEDYSKEKYGFEPAYIKDELQACLCDIDVAYTAYSTSTLEVVCQNVFLINLCPPGKLRNTGAPDGIGEKYYKVVYDELEVFEALDMALQMESKNKNGMDFTELLEPVNKETVNRMWE